MMTGTVVLVRAGVIASAMVGIATAVGLIPRQMPPQFSSEERTQLVQYWSDPSRYSVGEPASAAQKGLWQVRLTPEGSTWLWSYNRARKISTPPTADAKPQNDQQKAWETWIVAKLHHDRWQALQEARAANQQAQGLELPLPDKDTPLDEPQDPGPIPTDLEVLAGDPPPFAASVSPKQFSINFDDGTIQYQDNVKLGSPRYAYYRFSDGVMSEGTVVKNVDPSRLDKLFALAGCDDTQSHVMRAVSQLEGGFDAVNTYDTGYVSVGFIQFASLKEGSGSLGTMLLSYKQDDPADFAADFHRYGVDVQPNGLLDVVDPETGTEEFGPDANRRIIADKRLIAVFQHAGQKSDAFCAAQIKAARAQFYPADDSITVNSAGFNWSGKVSDLIHSEAGLATLFDRKVNTGNINLLPAVATQVASAHHCTSIDDLCACEREIVTGIKYRMDFTQDGTLSQPGGKRR